MEAAMLFLLHEIGKGETPPPVRRSTYGSILAWWERPDPFARYFYSRESSIRACNIIIERSHAKVESVRKIYDTLNEMIIALEHRHQDLRAKATSKLICTEAGRYYFRMANRYESNYRAVRLLKEELGKADLRAAITTQRARDISRILQGELEETDVKWKIQDARKYFNKAVEGYFYLMRAEYTTLHVAKRIWECTLKDTNKMQELKLSYENAEKCKNKNMFVVNFIFVLLSIALVASLLPFTVHSDYCYPILAAGIFNVVYSLTYCSGELYTRIKSRREESERMLICGTSTITSDIDEDWTELRDKINFRIRCLRRVLDIKARGETPPFLDSQDENAVMDDASPEGCFQ